MHNTLKNSLSLAASAMFSPQDGAAEPAPAEPTAPAEKKSSKVSNRIILGKDRKEADQYTDAYGFRYESLSEPGANCEAWFREPDGGFLESDKVLPADSIYALATAGALTYSGNATNTIRNGTPKADGPQTEKEALDQWLQNLMDGNWTKASGEIEPGMAELAEAVARTLSDNDKKDRSSDEALAKVKDYLSNLDKDARGKWRGDLRVKRHIAAIRKEKADKRAAAAPAAPLPEISADLDI